MTVKELILELLEQPLENTVVISRYLPFYEYGSDLKNIWLHECDGMPVAVPRYVYALEGERRPDLTYIG